ncbi:MAG: cytochrome C [Desulfuromonas sp.]|nr:cytochrome C [Desulfuromonas sp.]
MTKTKIAIALTMIALLGLLAACAVLDGGRSLSFTHPSAADIGAKPKVCSGCHEGGEPIPFARFDHTPFFADNHRLEATQYEQTCRGCHQVSFCNDCHATRVELKPSDRNPTDNDRRMPHRGDYLSRHRIDGRTDPVSCFRCHGNPKAARTCAPCHGK